MAGNVHDWSAETQSNCRALYGNYYVINSNYWYSGYSTNDFPTSSYDGHGTRMSLYIPASNSVTEKTYIKNGLILYLDGINNTGSGHSNTSTIWKDLSGNNNNGTITGATWKSTGLSLME